MSNLKAKICVRSLDLSAFVVTTMINGLEVDNVPVNFDVKEKIKKAGDDAERPQILNVELLITDKEDNSSSTVYGEIAICDFITQMSNSAKGGPVGEHALRLGQDLNFDDYVQKLNYGLRELTDQFVVKKNQEVKDDIKAFAKALEEAGFIADLVDNNKYGTFGMLHVMFFCYLEPVSKLLNKKL